MERFEFAPGVAERASKFVITSWRPRKARAVAAIEPDAHHLDQAGIVVEDRALAGLRRLEGTLTAMTSGDGGERPLGGLVAAGDASGLMPSVANAVASGNGAAGMVVPSLISAPGGLAASAVDAATAR